MGRREQHGPLSRVLEHIAAVDARRAARKATGPLLQGQRYSVVPFTGLAIRDDWATGNWMTDWHVVDERGRTVRIFAARFGRGHRSSAQSHAAAERYATKLNDA